jgi:hypothetical protein
VDTYYSYTKVQEECAICDEQVSAALRFDEIGEEPPEELHLECGHIWKRGTRVHVTDLKKGSK